MSLAANPDIMYRLLISKASTSPCKLTTEMLPVLADSTCQANLSYTAAGPRIRYA